MKITQEIRDYAEAGMQEKSREFREAGGDVYLREPAETKPAVPL
jgi:hypothetical protein